jgi:hypothetical protein
VVGVSFFVSHSGCSWFICALFGLEFRRRDESESQSICSNSLHASHTTSPVPTCLTYRTIHTTRRVSASDNSDERGFQ